MVTHMKTTIEIADALLDAAKRRAEKEGSTLRALVEEGLRRLLRDKAPTRGGIRRATFRGQGIRPEVKEGSWDRIRDEIYEGRGT
jgi:Arc/MetJ family transcription regulator